jgi:hypothetical protein
MEHLFSSVVRTEHMVESMSDGVPSWDWVPYGDARNAIRCRLDLNFIRPGKDAPPAQEAGRAPDRIGVMFCGSTAGIRAGDRIVTVSGPVVGTFDIKAIPDVAVDYASAHHIEVQIIETNQQLAGRFPGEPEQDD